MFGTLRTWEDFVSLGVDLSKISYLMLILVNHEGHTKEKQIHQITIKNLIHCNLYLTHTTLCLERTGGGKWGGGGGDEAE